MPITVFEWPQACRYSTGAGLESCAIPGDGALRASGADALAVRAVVRTNRFGRSVARRTLRGTVGSGGRSRVCASARRRSADANRSGSRGAFGRGRATGS